MRSSRLAERAAVGPGLIVVRRVVLFLEGLDPAGPEVAELAFPEVALVALQRPPHPAPVHALDVDVEAEVVPVPDHVRVVAPGPA
jgi:hypothetical protein